MSNNKILLWSLLAAWIAGSAYWHVCRIKNLCDADFMSGVNSSTAQIEPLIITDNPYLSLKSEGNLSFPRNGISANKTTVTVELDSLVNYLISYPNSLLTITGQYSESESNSSEFPNLGIARANGIKNWLRGKGIADSLITIKSEARENLAFVNDSLRGGIEFSFHKKPILTELDLANDQRFITIFKPLDLYFATASASYIKTVQNQKFISEAKKYMADSLTKKLIVIGHTDNEDSSEWNMTLSKKRANAVKNELIASGIPADRIISIGKGETEPKHSNDTPEGKRANRRVTVFVRRIGN